jgi:C4-dicarboxylate-specific signal transduction histidine kinase
VDRHKVLQILINLLRNSKYALDEQGGQAKRLVVRVGMAAPDRVKISIADNGIGIAPDCVTRIFNHGFTTKRKGHGFGLHSGANAAREMGGALTAHSDGLGKGAEFTLELPITAARQEEQPGTQTKA